MRVNSRLKKKVGKESTSLMGVSKFGWPIGAELQGVLLVIESVPNVWGRFERCGRGVRETPVQPLVHDFDL